MKLFIAVLALFSVQAALSTEEVASKDETLKSALRELSVDQIHTLAKVLYQQKLNNVEKENIETEETAPVEKTENEKETEKRRARVEEEKREEGEAKEKRGMGENAGAVLQSVKQKLHGLDQIIIYLYYFVNDIINELETVEPLVTEGYGYGTTEGYQTTEGGEWGSPIFGSSEEEESSEEESEEVETTTEDWLLSDWLNGFFDKKRGTNEGNGDGSSDPQGNDSSQKDDDGDIIPNWMVDIFNSGKKRENPEPSILINSDKREVLKGSLRRLLAAISEIKER